jgi:hypothetical protein
MINVRLPPRSAPAACRKTLSPAAALSRSSVAHHSRKAQASARLAGPKSGRPGLAASYPGSARLRRRAYRRVAGAVVAGAAW